MKGNSLAGTLLFLAAASVILPLSAENTGEQFTSFDGFHLDVGRLSDVEQKLGQVKLVQTGDAGEYEASICYRTDSGLIYFLSGELGGSSHDLLAFKFAQDDPAAPCADWPKSKVSPKLEIAGLHLGMTKNEFENVVSNSVKWDGDIGRVFFLTKDPFTPKQIAQFPQDLQDAIKSGKEQDYADIQVSVEGTFSSGKLSELEIWKTETL